MELNKNNEQIDTQRNYNLDLIKAISIVLVLIWHLQPFDISIPNITRFSVNIIFKEALNVLYFQVTLIAVPSFLIISQYIYFQKLKQYGYIYFFKRLAVLFYITIFWISAQFLFYYLVIPLLSAGTITLPPPTNISDWLRLIMIGGPFKLNSNTNVGSSAFYYLTTLIALTIFSTLYAIACRNKQLEKFISILIISMSLIYFQQHSFKEGVITYSRIENFIIYIPIAHLVNSYRDRLRYTANYVLWAGYFLFCFQDVYLRTSGFQFNIYGRVSIVFGATALICSLINKKNTTEAPSVRFLSSHSLGIFALHLYIQYFMTLYLMPIFSLYYIRRKMPFWEFRINFQVLSIGLLTVLVTFICVYILGKTPLRKFVK
ncbi:MAG: acyltransferase family protein [Anaerolineales bacterium]|nr:acyltransferase family protein [Anaerolineales bacterium]